jgi:hypothetical protein
MFDALSLATNGVLNNFSVTEIPVTGILYEILPGEITFDTPDDLFLSFDTPASTVVVTHLEQSSITVSPAAPLSISVKPADTLKLTLK